MIGLADHAQACYGRSIAKSMEVVELAVSKKVCWQKMAMTLPTRLFQKQAFSEIRKC